MILNNQRWIEIDRTFERIYRSKPTTWVRAPGRVDLMGSHTDYNRGYVLTLPIGLDLWIAARSRSDRRVQIHSMNLQMQSEFSLDSIGRDGPLQWSDYLRAVAFVLQEEHFKLSGFDAVLHGTVPLRSGLSSSAALECATATLFEALDGFSLDPIRKAILCQRSENQFVGVQCGILDQYTSCLGRAGCALLLDCRDLSSRPVQLPAEIQVVVCNTKYQRELVSSEYGARRSQCEQGSKLLGFSSLREVNPQDFRHQQAVLPSEIGKRCRFIVEENERVLQLAEALEKSDYKAVDRLCADSFRGACELYEISVPAMRQMMEAMLAAPGIIGARQAGAGFGGCMVAFVNKELTDAFIDSVCRSYFDRTQIRPEIIPVSAAEGAGIIPYHGQYPDKIQDGTIPNFIGE